MMELLKNAWFGWENYIQNSKLAILLIVALLYFLFYKKEEVKKSWVKYTTVMTMCCIVPVTAAALMQYQTKFYDYPWIWSAVPLTAMIACAATSLLYMEWTKKGESGSTKGKLSGKSGAMGSTAMVLLVFLLCGSLGQSNANDGMAGVGTTACEFTDKEEISNIQKVAEELRQALGEEAEICLWAPREVMETIRLVDGNVKLLYGRNMWDASLNAYAYDTYPSEVVMLSEQMEAWDTRKTPEAIAKLAQNAGANCILLPIDTDKSIVMRMANQLNVVPQTLEAYWLLYE